MLNRWAVLSIAVILSVLNLNQGVADTFDGLYKGTMDLNTGVENNPQCSKTWVVTLEVKGNRMSLSTDIKPVNLYEVYVGTDGKFNGKASATGDGQWRTFMGTIAGSNVTGQFNNQYCHYNLDFKKAQ